MEINKDRFPNKSEAELEVMAKNGDYDFFKLPFCLNQTVLLYIEV